MKAYRVCTNLTTGPAISFTQDLQPAITRPANAPVTLSITATAPGIAYPYAFMYQWQSNSAAAPAKPIIGYTVSSGKLLLNWTNAGPTLQNTPSGPRPSPPPSRVRLDGSKKDRLAAKAANA